MQAKVDSDAHLIEKDQIFGGDKPTRAGFFAGSNSGKSSLLSEILASQGDQWGVQSKYKPDRIYILSPTISFDDAYDKVLANLEKRSTQEHKFDRKKQIFEEGIEQSLKTIYEHIFDEQRGKKEAGYEKDNTMIILDDCQHELDLSSPHSQISRILCKCRHANITVIILMQHAMNLSLVARNQLNVMIFFSQANSDEHKKVRTMVSSGMKPTQFDSLYSFCTGEPFNYMLVMTQLPVNLRFFKGCGNNLSQIKL